MTIQGKAAKNVPFIDQTPYCGAGGHRALELGGWKDNFVVDAFLHIRRKCPMDINSICHTRILNQKRILAGEVTLPAKQAEFGQKRPNLLGWNRPRSVTTHTASPTIKDPFLPLLYGGRGPAWPNWTRAYRFEKYPFYNRDIFLANFAKTGRCCLFEKL